MDALPQPNSVLTTDEFLASLDDTNPMVEAVREVFRECDPHIMEIYKKDSSLYEMIKGRISVYRLPIVDKPLRVVIEAREGHERLTGALYAYHAAAAGEDPSMWDVRTWGQRYHQRGYGYYFTGAYGNTRTVIITEHAYKPDRFDRDLLGELGA